MVKNKRIIAIALSAMLAGELVSPAVSYAEEPSPKETTIEATEKSEDEPSVFLPSDKKTEQNCPETTTEVKDTTTSTSEDTRSITSSETSETEANTQENTEATTEATTSTQSQEDDQLTNSTSETEIELLSDNKDDSTVFEINSSDDFENSSLWEKRENQGWCYIGDKDITINLSGDFTSNVPIRSDNQNVKLYVNGNGHKFTTNPIYDFSKIIFDNVDLDFLIAYTSLDIQNCSLDENTNLYYQYNITFTDCTLDSVGLTNMGGCKLMTFNHCNIINGLRQNNYAAIKISDCTITNSQIYNPSGEQYAVTIESSKFINSEVYTYYTKISDCSFTSDETSKYTDELHLFGHWEVQNCEFTGQNTGFSIGYSDETSRIENCTFTDMKNGIYRSSGCSQGEIYKNLKFKNCKVGANIATTMASRFAYADSSLQAYGNYGENGVLYNCEFTDCEIGSIASGCVLSKCTFKNNTKYAVKISYGNAILYNSNIYMNSSDSIGLTSDAGAMAFDCNFYGNGTGISNITAVLYSAKCKFYNKSIGINYTGSANCYAYKNNFIGNTIGISCEHGSLYVSSGSFLNCTDAGIYQTGNISVLDGGKNSQRNLLVKIDGNSVQYKRNVFQGCNTGIRDKSMNYLNDILVTDCNIGIETNSRGESSSYVDNIEISDCLIGMQTNLIGQYSKSYNQGDQSNAVYIHDCTTGINAGTNENGRIFNHTSLSVTKDNPYAIWKIANCSTGVNTMSFDNDPSFICDNCETGININGNDASNGEHSDIRLIATNCKTGLKIAKLKYPVTLHDGSLFKSNKTDVNTRTNLKIEGDSLSTGGYWNVDDDAYIETSTANLVNNIAFAGSVDGTYAGREVARVSNVADSWKADEMKYKTKGYRVVSNVEEAGTEDEYTSYKLAEGFTITYNYEYNGGTELLQGSKYESGSVNTTVDITAKAAKPGYEFVGWSKSKNGTDKDCISTVHLNDDVTLYAIYKKQLAIDYKDKDGSTLYTDTAVLWNNDKETNISIKHGKDESHLTDGASLQGFSVKSNSTNTLNLNDQISVSKDTELYAVYKLSGTLNYMADGLDLHKEKYNVLVPYTASFDDVSYQYTLQTPPKKQGYTAVGWSETEHDSDKLFDPGYSYITKDADKTLYAQYKVIACEDLTIAPEDITISVTETAKMKPVISPSNASTKTLHWSSSDDTVATVDQDGNIVGKKEGTCKITAITMDGSGLSSVINVTVYTRNVSILGILKDSKNRPIANKTVVVEETNDTLTTDADGHVALNKKPAGEYTFTVYQDKTKVLAKTKVSVGTNKKLDNVENIESAKGIKTTGYFGVNNSLSFTTTLTLINNINVPDEIWIRPGEDKTIVPEITPDSVYDDTLTWTAADDNIATVDQNGKITGIKKGDTKVTVTANDDGEVSKDILVHVIVRSTDIGGTVKDTNGKALTGDKVKIKGTDQNAIIDKNGSYSFADLDEGTYTIQVIHDNTVIAEYETTIGQDKDKDLVKETNLVPGVTSSYQYGTNEDIRADFIVQARDLEVTPKEAAIFIEDTVQIETTVPEMIYSKDLTYHSDDDSIATVNKNGLITGKKVGEVKIHVGFSDSNEIDKVITIHVKRHIRETGVNGTIIDTNGKPLTDYNVQIKGTDQTTKTDSHGAFSFTGLKEGTYTIDIMDDTRILAEYEATVGENKESDIEKELSILKGIKSKYTYGKSETMEASFTVQARDMTVTPKEATIYPDESVQIKTTIPDMIYKTDLTYRSEDPKIATVDENGLITGVSEGDVKIHVRFTDSDEVDKVVTVHVKRHIRITSLTGSIIDTNGKALAGYPVRIKDLNLTVKTDQKGHYIFENLKEGSYTVDLEKEDGTLLAEYEASIGEDKSKDKEKEIQIKKGITAKYLFGSKETPDADFTVQARELDVTPKEADLFTDESIQIQTKMPDMIYKTDLIWSSDDPSIATVDDHGLIVAHKKGDTMIHVRFADSDEIDQVITIHVKEKEISTTQESTTENPKDRTVALKGSIRYANGKKVKDITVKFNGNKEVVDGAFLYKDLSEGSYSLEVKDKSGNLLCSSSVIVGQDSDSVNVTEKKKGIKVSTNCDSKNQITMDIIVPNKRRTGVIETGDIATRLAWLLMLVGSGFALLLKKEGAEKDEEC